MKQISHDFAMCSAEFSPDRLYRWVLFRTWQPTRPPLVVVGLNPSTANESENDPTVTREVGFARRELRGGLVKLNAFALVSTDPKGLKYSANPVGVRNNAFLRQHCRNRDVVVAWGAHPQWSDRLRYVAGLLTEVGAVLFCFGTTKDGHPKHPLYLRSDTPLVRWEGYR